MKPLDTLHIPNRENYVSVHPIEKGWSKDIKYRLETKTGEKHLIRFSPFSLYEKKKDEFDALKSITSLNFPMSRPLEFGTTPDNTYVYMVFSWVEGEDLGDRPSRILLKRNSTVSEEKRSHPEKDMRCLSSIR